MRFSIITPTYNTEKWISKNIESVKSQTFNDFEHIIINDASTDNTANTILAHHHLKLRCFSRSEKVGIMSNHLFALKAAKGDIIIHLDGDDWLENNFVLDKINKFYEETGCLATYGSYISTNGDKQVNKPLNEFRSVRDQIKIGWCTSHLRTFSRSLVKLIPAIDIVDHTGILLSSATDVGLLTAIFDRANDLGRLEFIKDILVVYNMGNTNSEASKDISDQVRCALSVASNKELMELI